MRSSKTMQVIYLASPYSYKSKIPGLSWIIRHYRNYKITKIAGKLHDIYQKTAFILPITQSHEVAKHMVKNHTSFEAWSDRDLEFIRRSDEIWVVMMSGWKKSIGVQAEIKYAKSKRISVKYIDPNTLNFEVLKRESNKKSSTKTIDSDFSSVPTRVTFGCIRTY